MDNQNVKGADELIRRLKEARQYIDDDLPDVIGIEGVKHFKNNFQKESFNGAKWADRKTKRKGSTNNQKILSKSGELAEATTYRKEPGTVIFTNDKVYAEIHNEGGIINHPGGQRTLTFKRTTRGKNKGKTRFAVNNENATFSQKTNVGPYQINTPQRQFIGESPELMNNIESKAMRDLTKILNP